MNWVPVIEFRGGLSLRAVIARETAALHIIASLDSWETVKNRPKAFDSSGVYYAHVVLTV